MDNLRNRLIWVAACVILGVVGGLAVNYQHSFRKVDVSIDPGLNVTIYKDLGGDGAFNYNPNSKPIARLSASQTITIRDGTYDTVVSDPTHEYENPVVKFVVAPGTDSVAVSPSYTSSKLATLLANEQPAITQALQAEYPDFSQNYGIADEQLYEQGNWYGAVLTPSAPTSDALRVILQKQGGSWGVVTDPPQISIGEPSFPNIPTDVIESVDQLGNGS